MPAPSPYRDGSPAPEEEPLPDFGNGSRTGERVGIFVGLLLGVVAAWMGTSWEPLLAWGLFFALLMAVLVPIMFLEAPLRAWRARRHARALVAGEEALEARAASLPASGVLPVQAAGERHVRIALEADLEPGTAEEDVEVPSARAARHL